MRRSASIVLAAFTCLVGIPAAMARDLTFEDRVQAQKAIERVYYSHQNGATKPFEEAVPRALLEKKVRTYLKLSVALELFWHAPVTAVALRSELERIAEETRFPERLREIYEALGNDSFLIEECYVRPFLVDRLARNFYAFDGRLQDDSGQDADRLRRRTSWDDWWIAARGRLDD